MASMPDTGICSSVWNASYLGASPNGETRFSSARFQTLDSLRLWNSGFERIGHATADYAATLSEYSDIALGRMLLSRRPTGFQRG